MSHSKLKLYYSSLGIVHKDGLNANFILVFKHILKKGRFACKAGYVFLLIKNISVLNEMH